MQINQESIKIWVYRYRNHRSKYR